jgi:HK97 family phage major capsid protein
MRKKTLEKRLARLNEKIKTLRSRALASEDANEVRSINEQIAEINDDIADVQEEIEAINAEERAAEVALEQRSTPPAEAVTVNGSVIESMNVQKREANMESIEYRNAFKAYVQRGAEIPAEYRNGDATNTANAGAVIPMTIMNEVINTVRKRYGNLYAKVRKTSVKGGVKYPIGALSATFKWISESTVSPRQKAGNVATVTFEYNTAEIRIAQTFLSSILSLTDFENKLTEIIAVAYLQAMDEGIVNGSGNGQMLGILNDPRVTNTVTMTAAEFSDWAKWRKKFFAQLPLGYRSGEFIFAASTVDAYLETMADSNNNPIFRQATWLEVNDGDAANPNGRFFGRNISLVEPEIIADFDTASANDVVGIYWQPEEYAVNENFGFTMRRYFDEETNEYVDKAIVVVDGKVLNPTGFYKILKG